MRQIGFRKAVPPEVLLVKEARDPQPGVNHLSFAEAYCLDRELRLVLKARVPALDQKGSGVRDCPADGFGPACFRLGKVAQNEVVDERLVAGMADPHAR